jgi:serine phosphatase RsbU (regulator of sigma subunit)
VSEAANKRAEQFGEERIMQTLIRAVDVTPARFCEQLTEEVTAFSGPERPAEDDRTLLVVRFLSSLTRVRACEPCQTAIAQVA